MVRSSSSLHRKLRSVFRFLVNGHRKRFEEASICHHLLPRLLSSPKLILNVCLRNRMSNNKMKGLLKGLRYISQIFDNDEEEPEMQIGFPTDVKHVAHIGWDGPSVSSPSWMSEFRSQPPYSSAPLSLNGDVKEEGSAKWESEGSNRKGSRAPNSPAGVPGSPGGSQSSPSRDFPELPKSSRRRSSTGTLAESPSREKSDKPKQSRRSSRNGTKELDGTRTSRNHKDPSGESESRSNLPDIPKKSRRKKSKDVSVEGSTSRSRSKAPAPEGGGESEMITKSSNYNEHRQTRGSSASRDGEESGLSGIS